MVSAMTSAMELTINSSAEQMDLHFNNFTPAVNSLTSTTSSNLHKDGQNQRIHENPEHPDNSETGKVDEVLTIHEDDRTAISSYQRVF